MHLTTWGTIALAALAVIAAACSRQAPAAVPEPDPLLGRWSLRYDPPPVGRLGTRLTVLVDSTAGDSLFGSVESMLSGNVGVDATVFDRLRGARADSTVTLFVPPAAGQRLSLELSGTLAADTIWISSFRMTGEEMLRGTTRVLLVKERAPTSPGA